MKDNLKTHDMINHWISVIGLRGWTITTEAIDKKSSIARPLYQQAFRWFREVYDMAHEITYAGAKGRYNAFTDDWVYDSNGELKKFSYEEAELACLRKLIEIVNQNKDER
jgi:hypothetical protein